MIALVVYLWWEDRYMDAAHLSQLKKIDLSEYVQEWAYYAIPWLYMPQDDTLYPDHRYLNRMYPWDAIKCLMFGILYNTWTSYAKLWWEANLKKSIECYQKAVELDPKHASAWYNMWSSYFKLKDYRNFIKCRDECKKLDKNLKEQIESDKIYLIYKIKYASK